MYLAMVVTLMGVLPVLSTIIVILVYPAPVAKWWLEFGRWLVFWGVGARLLIAGVRQATRPAFTLQTLLGVEQPEAFLVVRELGFANIAIGTVALISLAVRAWVLASASAGFIFLGLAGLSHSRKANRNRFENIAMISDLLMATVLLAYSTIVVVVTWGPA